MTFTELLILAVLFMTLVDLVLTAMLLHKKLTKDENKELLDQLEQRARDAGLDARARIQSELEAAEAMGLIGKPKKRRKREESKSFRTRESHYKPGRKP